MLSKVDFYTKFGSGVHLLDGATGTALIAEGMPVKCCKAQWILEHADIAIALQRDYVRRGSEILYAPSFLADPLTLERYALGGQAEDINARLTALSRQAAPECLIAGDLTTLRGHMDTGDPRNFDAMTAAYLRQIRGLVKGGADLLVGETLLHPQEAQAILSAAQDEGVPCVMISFALTPDGLLRSGDDAAHSLLSAQQNGAVAVGMNCIAADNSLPVLVARCKDAVQVPLICKPNAGRAVNGVHPVSRAGFTRVMRDCVHAGASLVGGCCGTNAQYIESITF